MRLPIPAELELEKDMPVWIVIDSLDGSVFREKDSSIKGGLDVIRIKHLLVAAFALMAMPAHAAWQDSPEVKALYEKAKGEEQGRRLGSAAERGRLDSEGVQSRCSRHRGRMGR